MDKLTFIFARIKTHIQIRRKRKISECSIEWVGGYSLDKMNKSD